MVVHAFLGHEKRTYPHFRDLATGVTLIAEPGGVYDIEPAQGAGPVAVPPDDGRWGPPITPAKPRKTAKTTATAAEGTNDG